MPDEFVRTPSDMGIVDILDSVFSGKPKKEVLRTHDEGRLFRM